jgi:hypothetical protein
MLSVEPVLVGVYVPPVPVVTNVSFTIMLPFFAGEPIGTMTASGGPTTWVITAVSGNGASINDFVINSESGVISATANAVTDITTPGVVTITATAANAGGVSAPGTATVTVEPAVLTWFESLSIQPQYPRWKRQGALLRGDDGTEARYSRVVWFESQGVQPTLLSRRKRAGVLPRGDEGIELPSIAATAVLVAGQAGPGITVNFGSSTDAGDLVGAITVTTNVPGTYHGTISIGGTNAADFSLSPSSNVSSAAYPCSLYVSQSNLAAGSYSITLTALP